MRAPKVVGRNLRQWLGALTVLVALGGVAAPAAAAPLRLAVVVGYNGARDADLQPLRYADDDAIRYAELLEHVADQTWLLTEVDDDSRRLYGHVDAMPPTRHNLRSVLETVRKRVAAVGGDAIVWFVYTGHGNYAPDGTGYVFLADGRWTTRDLYRDVIIPLDPVPTILVVDACNAALLVRSRGPARRPARPSRLFLENFPHVGVVLSASGVGEVHEWGKYLSGVFSHEVRSGIVGPADIDADGRVTFPELAAFVAAANRDVDNPALRLRPYIRPPLAYPDLPVVDLSQSHFPLQLEAVAHRSGHGWVADERMVRYADFNVEAGRRFTLHLPDAGREWIVVQAGRQWVVEPGHVGHVSLELGTGRPLTAMVARGPLGDYFERHLFATAYTQRFASDYFARRYVDSLVVEHPLRRPWYRSTTGWVLFSVGLTGLAAGTGLHVGAVRARDRALDAQDAAARRAANAEVTRYNRWSIASFAVGGAALSAAVATFILDRPIEVHRYRPPFEVGLGPAGLVIRVRR